MCIREVLGIVLVGGVDDACLCDQEEAFSFFFVLFCSVFIFFEKGKRKRKRRRIRILSWKLNMPVSPLPMMN